MAIYSVHTFVHAVFLKEKHYNLLYPFLRNHYINTFSCVFEVNMTFKPHLLLYSNDITYFKSFTFNWRQFVLTAAKAWYHVVDQPIWCSYNTLMNIECTYIEELLATPSWTLNVSLLMPMVDVRYSLTRLCWFYSRRVIWRLTSRKDPDSVVLRLSAA
jgi:hypothetical protein